MAGPLARTHTAVGAAATEAIAAELARTLRPGDLVALRGPMAAGKTTFVRGACRALGVEGAVSSPTFTIGRLHRPRGERDLAVAHLDLYRLGSFADEEPGFLDDYVNPATVAFVEWFEIAAGELGEPAVEVSLEHAGDDVRTIEIRDLR